MTEEIQELIKKIKEKCNNTQTWKKEGLLEQCLNFSVKDPEIFDALFQEFYKDYTGLMISMFYYLNEKQTDLLVSHVLSTKNEELASELVFNKHIEGEHYHSLVKILDLSSIYSLINQSRTTQVDIEYFISRIEKEDNEKLTRYYNDILCKLYEKCSFYKEYKYSITKLACKKLDDISLLNFTTLLKEDENYNMCVNEFIKRNALDCMIRLGGYYKTTKEQFNKLFDKIFKNNKIGNETHHLLLSEFITHEQINLLVEKMQNSNNLNDIFEVLSNKKIQYENLDKMLDLFLEKLDKQFINANDKFSNLILEPKIQGENVDKIIKVLIEKELYYEIPSDKLVEIANNGKVTGKNYDSLVEIICKKRGSLTELADTNKIDVANFEKIVNIFRKCGASGNILYLMKNRLNKFTPELFNSSFVEILKNVKDIYYLAELINFKILNFEQFCMLIDKIKSFNKTKAFDTLKSCVRYIEDSEKNQYIKSAIEEIQNVLMQEIKESKEKSTVKQIEDLLERY